MLPQSIEKRVTSGLYPNSDSTKNCKETAESFQSPSYCSCSQCELESCFKLRNHSDSSCTCSLCKNPKTCSISKKDVTKDITPTPKNNGESVIRNEIDTIEKELNGEITKVAKSEFDNREYTKFICKDISVKKDKIDRKGNDKSYEKSTTRQYVHSVSVNYLPNERKNSTAKLSAQVMNLPYQDIEDSLTVVNPRRASSPFNFKDIVKPDFLTRLKEIYNACSCKVCECITSISLPLDECQCKPCDCEKCAKHLTNLNHDPRKAPHEGCPCVSCDRKDCKGVVKTNDNTISCSCIPCDCMECTNKFVKSCNCEPCQCIECKAFGAIVPRTVIVAPAHGNTQQNPCDCEPCECLSCTQNYGAMSLRRQVSSDVISNRNCRCESCPDDACQLNNDVCRCDMNSRVMKKPIERRRDYDIHRTLVDSRSGTSKFNNRDTIVTFALCNKYTDNVTFSKSNDCECSNCECVVCKEKDIYRECNFKLHSETISKYKPSFESLRVCKCSPCECQICNRRTLGHRKLENDVKITCECNTCDCVSCKGFHDSKINNSAIGNETNIPLFQEALDSISRETSQFLNRNLLTSMLDSNTCFTSQEKNYNLTTKRENKDVPYFKVTSNRSSCKKSSHHQTVTACRTESNHNNVDNSYNNVNNHQTFELPEKDNLFNDRQNTGLRKTLDDLRALEKNIILFKNDLDDNVSSVVYDNLNIKSRNPIRDISILDEFINLTNSSSRIKIQSKDKGRDDYDINGVEALERKRISNLIPTASKASMRTFNLSARDSRNIPIERQIVGNLRAVSSECIILCDRKSSSIVVESKDVKNIFETNATNSNNYSESDYNLTNDVMLSDSVAFPCNEKTIKIEVKDSNSKDNNNTLNKDLISPGQEMNVTENEEKVLDFKTSKNNKKCIGKKFNKMYSKLNKIKQRKHTINIDEKNIKITDRTQSKSKENDFSEVIVVEKEKNLYSVINEQVMESLEHSGTCKKELISLSKDPLATSIEKSFVCVNSLGDILATQNQTIDSGDSNDAWSIMKKNLYVSCTHVPKNKGISTIPNMEFDTKTLSKSISMQTSDCAYNLGKSNGKHALTRLLVEVHNLLKSPLLKSSHSCNFANITSETNYLTQNKFQLRPKIILNDAMSQTAPKMGPIDKETYCDIIQSMEVLQRNVKSLMDRMLTNAVYKSELLATKLNYTQNINKINSCNSSCYGLKATFIGLRTISDHTVMVKWRLPREVGNVQGYELQVDGRPVQKIISPTRCMAILTCLPHSETLLLTIRTLTTRSLPFDHLPATTIVYRPRIK